MDLSHKSIHKILISFMHNHSTVSWYAMIEKVVKRWAYNPRNAKEKMAIAGIGMRHWQ